MSELMVIMYILPGTGCTLSDQERIIAVAWAFLGVVFAILCKLRYKEKFAKLDWKNM